MIFLPVAILLCSLLLVYVLPTAFDTSWSDIYTAQPIVHETTIDTGSYIHEGPSLTSSSSPTVHTHDTQRLSSSVSHSQQPIRTITNNVVGGTPLDNIFPYYDSVFHLSSDAGSVYFYRIPHDGVLSYLRYTYGSDVIFMLTPQQQETYDLGGRRFAFLNIFEEGEDKSLAFVEDLYTTYWLIRFDSYDAYDAIKPSLGDFLHL